MSNITEASTNSPVDDTAKRLNKLQVNKIKKAVSFSKNCNFTFLNHFRNTFSYSYIPLSLPYVYVNVLLYVY